jgi:hypothetical protein
MSPINLSLPVELRGDDEVTRAVTSQRGWGGGDVSSVTKVKVGVGYCMVYHVQNPCMAPEVSKVFQKDPCIITNERHVSDGRLNLPGC